MMNRILIFLALLSVSLGCGLISGEQDKDPNDKAPTPIPADSPADLASPTPAAAAGALSKDLLSIGAGATLVSVSSEYTPGELARWSGYGAIDESLKVGWASKDNAVTDQYLVIELPSETTFSKIGFDTAGVDTEGAGAKSVVVEVSTTSANSGFSGILTTTLDSAVDNQNFDVEIEKPAKWVRINAKDNHGSTNWLEIMEVRGYGVQKPIEGIGKDVSGTYKTEQWGDFHIKQEGTSIVGCYEYNGGLLEGGLEGNVMYLNWDETGDGEQTEGPAVFLFDKEGKSFQGFWRYAANDYYNGKWDGEKTSDEVGNCEHFKKLNEANASGSQLEEKLEKDGRAVVYGINFDFNSDQIKEESKGILNQVVAVLKKNSDWKMTIEGHTDNIGGQSFNQKLSEKRANAVKKFLVDAGIDGGRLSAKGVGMSSPVAKNTSEEGRARNRRVELVKE